MAPPVNYNFFLLLSLFIIGTTSRITLDDPRTTPNPFSGHHINLMNDFKLIFSTIPSTPGPMKVDVFNAGTVQPTELTSINSAESSYTDCGMGKKCVELYLCSNGKIIEDGGTVFNTRFSGGDSCPQLETCCSIEETDDEIINCPSKIPTGCGYRNVGGIGYKILEENNESQFAEFPWMVAVMHKNDPLNTQLIMYKCGGSLLTPQVVLTGAHCVQEGPPDSYIVRAGEWEPGSDKEVCPDQRSDVVEIIVHEQFNKKNLYNDVALLFIDPPFDLAPNVNTVCLPPPDFDFDYSKCFATGWGKDKFHNGRYPSILKKIDLPAVPRAQCQANLRKTRLGRFFRLHSTFMCAGGERGKDMCKGDGGSPLVCPINNSTNRYYQAGIVAWGVGCGDENVPGVYASIPRLRAWIDKKLAAKNIEPSFYTAS